jgi:hypothetical protein
MDFKKAVLSFLFPVHTSILRYYRAGDQRIFLVPGKNAKGIPHHVG